MRRFGAPRLRSVVDALTTREALDKFYADVAYLPGDCWLWAGNRTAKGYGRAYFGGCCFMAHRLSFILSRGDIPEGRVLDHLCRTTECVNPYHLEPTTDRVNVLESLSVQALNAKKTHCNRGHEFNEENTYLMPKGGRSCRACSRFHTKNWQAAGKGRSKVERNWCLQQKRRLARLEVDPWSVTPKGANGRWKALTS